MAKLIVLLLLSFFATLSVFSQITYNPRISSNNNSGEIERVTITNDETIVLIKYPRQKRGRIRFSYATVLVPCDAMDIGIARKLNLTRPYPALGLEELFAKVIEDQNKVLKKLSQEGMLIRSLGNNKLDVLYDISDKKHDCYYFELHFDKLPVGCETVYLRELVEDGFEWYGIEINNPFPTTPNVEMTEESIMQNIDQNNDGICGIYEETTKKNTGQYKLACIKENGSYRLIYMNSVKKMYWWRMGDVKAELRPSATAGVFKADWYMQDKTLNEDAYIVFDGNTMKSVINDEENLYLKMYPSVVGINAPNTKVSEEWSGTGFALNNGYIVTNYHVVENAKSIKVEGIGDSPDTKYDATVVSTDQHNDLAIIKINDHRFKGFGRLPYKVKTQLSEVGEDVFVLGYPMTTSMGNEIKLTTGVVSARSGFQGNVSLYQITAPIQPGNSGGPLFDSNGNLVGIVNAKHVGAENVGYAIKASYLYGLAESASIESSLPQNNSVSGLSLSEKVKKLKRYVYMISCSSK